MKKLLLLVLACNYSLLSLAQNMDLIFYNSSNSPAFTSNNFKSIGVGKKGYIWAGTANQGLYKCKDSIWVKSTSALTNHNIADIKTDINGAIWIAQYGSAGAQATGGGINYFPDTTFSNTFYATQDGLPTRNVRSLYVNNNAINVILPTYRVWSAHLADITGGQSRTGAVGIGTNAPSPSFITRTAGVETANGAGSCQTIGGDSSEVWVFASNNFGHSQILRYDAVTTGFKGFYDDTNTPLPAGFTAKAIYFDKDGRAWVGMLSGGMYVFQNNSWQQINFSDVFPPGAIVNNNAITGDKMGRVYIGTTNGLVVCNGGPVNSNSSYKLYTGNANFSLGSVQAIAIDTLTRTAYSVIMATTNGIARWKPFEPIEVFNIKKGNPAPAGRYKFEYVKTMQNIMVAADSSTSTLFRVVWPDANQYKLRFKKDPLGTDTSKYGFLTVYQRYNDSIIYTYHHPADPVIAIDKFSRKDTLQIVNIATNTVVYEETIEIVRPPLLLVHGLFSNGEDAFGNMKRNLVSSGLYKQNQICIVNYPSDRQYSETYPVVIAYKNYAEYSIVRLENISFGKMDVAGHSMGGLLLRLYLQNNQYSYDVNKYVSFNSPHMGSPVPNLVLNNIILKTAVRMIGDPDGGALFDLKVNSPQTMTNLIHYNMYEKKVPTHVIVTTFNPSPLKILLPLVPAAIANPSLINVLVLGYYGIGYYNNTLFAGIPHDIVVSEVSQKCGLDLPYYSYFTGQNHSSTGGPNPDVLSKFKQLLSTSADDASLFTKGGFHPDTIPVPDNLYRLGQLQTGTLNITGPANNSNYATGSNITLDFNYTLVDTMIFQMSNNSKELYAARIDAPSTSLNFTIPSQYFGTVKILIQGYNQSGFSAMDSVKINVTTNATLDTLLFDPEQVSVPKTGYALIKINGLFSDQVLRNLTGDGGFTYSFATNKAAFQAPDKIIGLAEGLDTLKISFQGKSAYLPIQITSQSDWVLLVEHSPLPAKLGPLTGRLKNGEVYLEWKIYDDIDVSKYEVQYSPDGTQYTIIGSVSPANINYEKTYTFSHSGYKNGNNLYRIKVIEYSGNVIYTNIAGVRINGNLNIEIATNPVQQVLHLRINAKQDDNITIVINDVSGKEMLKKQQAVKKGINNIDIPVPTISNGLYFLRIGTITEMISEKFIKTN